MNHTIQVVENEPHYQLAFTTDACVLKLPHTVPRMPASHNWHNSSARPWRVAMAGSVLYCLCNTGYQRFKVLWIGLNQQFSNQFRRRIDT